MTDLGRRTGRLLMIASLLSAAQAAQAFECPVKAPPTTKMVPDLARIIKPNDDPRDDPSLKAAIATLKGEGMGTGEIVDHVIAAYCPTVDALPKLGDKDKDAIVQRFASHLAQAVYAPKASAVDDIILDVPVPPPLFGKIKEAADRKKQSQDAFVLDALQKAVGTP